MNKMKKGVRIFSVMIIIVVGLLGLIGGIFGYLADIGQREQQLALTYGIVSSAFAIASVICFFRKKQKVYIFCYGVSIVSILLLVDI